MRYRRTLVLSVVSIVMVAFGVVLFSGRTDARLPLPPGRPAVDGAQKLNADCAAMWLNGLELQGVVGEREAQAYFDTWPAPGVPDGPVSGILVFPRERKSGALADATIGLEGAAHAEGCTVKLKDAEAGDAADTWQLQIESAILVKGTHHLPDGSTEPIVLSVVPETPCDGAGEWRTFSSPKWPITFEYPANWVLTADEDDVNIECPSITALATGGTALTFERGRFPPSADVSSREDGSAFNEPYWFVRNPGGVWVVDDFGCAHADDGGASCRPARTSERNGMTVLQGVAGEHRLYRAGIGYLGQGFELARYLFIFGDRWISLDSGANEHGVEEFGPEGGPLLLDGDSVGDRVVRSVRLR